MTEWMEGEGGGLSWALLTVELFKCGGEGWSNNVKCRGVKQ